MTDDEPLFYTTDARPDHWIDRLGLDYGISRLPDESDSDFRTRIRASLSSRLRDGTRASIENAIRLECPELSAFQINEEPGAVDINIRLADEVPDTAIEAIRSRVMAALSGVMPVGISWRVLVAQPKGER